MSNRTNPLGLIREKKELDAFLSGIMNEKASDLIRERQDLDNFLATFMGSDPTPVLSADAAPPEVVAENREVAVPEQELTLEKGVLQEHAIDAAPQVSAETPAALTVTESEFASYDREESVYPQEERLTAVEDKLSAGIGEAPTGDDAAAVPAVVAVAEESLPADISREQEQQPEASVSDPSPQDIPVLVMEGRDSASTETHAEEERHPVVASTSEAPAPVPLVLEERDRPTVDLQRADEEPVPAPRKEEIPAVSEEEPLPFSTSERLPEHGTALTLENMESATELTPEAMRRKDDELTADGKEIAKDEPPEKALPAVIIRKEALAESRRTPLDLDKTLDLQKSAPSTEEPTGVPEIADNKKISREEEVFGKTFKAKPQKPPTRSWVRAGVLFAIFAAMSAGYFGLYPDAGQQTIRWMASNIPFFDRLVEVDRKPEMTVYQQIKFTDIKQRFIYNIPLGRNIRIVEGNAVNQAAFPVSAIKILGELYDARDSVLASKVTYCGNVLSDEKLSTLGEAEIGSALSIPQGSDLSNSKVLPQNQVAFMIVFTSEPAGVVRTTITPISFAGVSP
jgi:hypothetical protein